MESNREAHQAKMKAQLDEWTAKIDVLKAKLAKAEASAKIELNHSMDELHKLHEAGQKQLDKALAASADAWAETKKGLDEGWSKVSGAVETLWKKVS
jgi:hypothetical protein